jgi:hypothetical protein
MARRAGEGRDRPAAGPVIKGRGIMHLDGNFKKDHPEHTVHSRRDEKGTWFVTRAGPRYLNVYEVTEFDDVGLEQLQKMEAPAEEPEKK